MHSKWLTYRVSWCNVRVKLGQSLWAGGALAKRLPLLQETDRQWEKNTSVSQCSDITHLRVTSLVGMEITTITDFHTQQQASTTVPEVRLEVLNYQVNDEVKRCPVDNEKSISSVYAEKMIYDGSICKTQQKQTNMAFKVSVKGKVWWAYVETSLLWFISGQAWLSEGIEGDLFGVTSTGEPEYPTSAVCSGTSEHKTIDSDYLFRYWPSG